MMYKIYDCLGQQIGNPRGYKTYNGALRMLASRVRGSLFNHVWDTYKQAVKANPSLCVVYNIKWKD